MLVRPSFLMVIMLWLVPATLFADVFLSPAKVELSLKAGSEVTQYLNITNRIGQEAKFNLSVEDFSQSADFEGGVTLGKSVDGLNSSLGRYISLDSSSFVLPNGGQARVPVKINLPKDVGPGGLYAAVLVSATPSKNEPGAAKIITRLGSLFFVKILGPTKESGLLKDLYFYPNKNPLENKVEITFENDGDIYLNPYGIINIYDFYSGRLVRSIEIDPWFVLPRSSRARIVTLGHFRSGKYTAHLLLNRGYQDIVDENYLNFKINFFSTKPERLFYLFVVLIIGFYLYKYKSRLHV